MPNTVSGLVATGVTGEKRIEKRHYVIGAQWQKNPAQLAKVARAFDILVTDQALRYDPIAGLKTTGALRACLKKNAVSD